MAMEIVEIVTYTQLQHGDFPWFFVWLTRRYVDDPGGVAPW